MSTIRALDSGERLMDDKVIDMSEIDYVNLMRLLDGDSLADVDYYRSKLKVQFVRAYQVKLKRLQMRDPQDVRDQVFDTLFPQMQGLTRSVDMKRNRLITYWNNKCRSPQDIKEMKRKEIKANLDRQKGLVPLNGEAATVPQQAHEVEEESAGGAEQDANTAEHLKRLRAKASKKKQAKGKDESSVAIDEIVEYFKSLSPEEREDALRVAAADVQSALERAPEEDQRIEAHVSMDIVEALKLIRDQSTFKAMNVRGKYQGFVSEAAAIDHHNSLMWFGFMAFITNRMSDMKNILVNPIHRTLRECSANKQPFPEGLREWLEAEINNGDVSRILTCMCNDAMDKTVKPFAPRLLDFLDDVTNKVSAGELEGELVAPLEEVKLMRRLVELYTHWLDVGYTFSEEEKKDFRDNLETYSLLQIIANATLQQPIDERLYTKDTDLTVVFNAFNVLQQLEETKKKVVRQKNAQRELMIRFLRDLDDTNDSAILYPLCKWTRFLQSYLNISKVLERIFQINPMSLALAYDLNASFDGTSSHFNEFGPSCHTQYVSFQPPIALEL